MTSSFAVPSSSAPRSSRRAPRRRAASGECRAPRAAPQQRRSRSRSRPRRSSSSSIDRFLRVTGSLAADEQAEVGAETAGRVDRHAGRARHARHGRARCWSASRATETSAQLQEADANAAQIEARLGLVGRAAVRSDARARRDEREGVARLGRGGVQPHQVAARSEGRVAERVRSAAHAGRGGAAAVPDGAERARSSRTARCRRRARASTLARKAVADTVVRAPFAGIVAERLVSTGDYVTRGTKVATVVRIDPVRVELTVPEQYVSLVKSGQAVRLTVDAYPGEVFAATVRFVSPALEPDQRALTVEAIAPNADGRLKPGLFATALLQQPDAAPGAARAGDAPSRRSPAPAASTSSRTATRSRSASSRLGEKRRRPRRDHERRSRPSESRRAKGRLRDGRQLRPTASATVPAF